MSEYRIVKLDFHEGTKYEVQKVIWKQVPWNHRYDTVDEAKRRIAYLKAMKQRKQEIIHEE